MTHRDRRQLQAADHAPQTPPALVPVAQVLDAMAGNHLLLLPVRDGAGEVCDFQIVAAAPGTVDSYGRRGRQLVGGRLRETHPRAIRGEVWEALRSAYLDGEVRTIGPVAVSRPAPDLPPMWFTATVRPVGEGLLYSWHRVDGVEATEERTTLVERLANLGVCEYDLVTGATHWSDGCYRLLGRDPADGPLSAEELWDLTVPSDRPVLREARRRVLAGRSVDVILRARVAGRVTHLRLVAEPVTGVFGQLLKVVLILQDVTARVAGGTHLANVERELSEHKATLAAESRLAAELQEIILPIPAEPVDLPGLQAAVRYLPADQANRIGGDWYHAGVAADGTVVIAVGDVAGHGLRTAAAMARQRHALATLTATATSEPAELLRHLNRLTYEMEETTGFASAVVGRFDPVSGVMRWAQAGHPAPLRTRGGVTTELHRPAGLLLGVDPDSDYETANTAIEPGDLILFYTDGLIEYRGQRAGDGRRRVVATLNRLSARHNLHSLAGLLEQLPPANPDDDTCIVGFRRL
jgi:serine phosphatase RsbU (regulator of sigma subunit)/PAS domain-containing protein